MVLKEQMDKKQREKPKLPPLYLYKDDGVYYLKTSSSGNETYSIKLSHQVFWVEGRMYDSQNGGQWMVLIKFYDGVGMLREVTVSYESLYRDANTVFADFAKWGLCFVTGKMQRDQVITLLMTQLDETPIPVMNSFGFYEDTGVYALPEQIIVPPWHKGSIPRLNADLSKHSNVICSTGTLDNWKNRMASTGTVMNKFLLCAGFSNVFFGILDFEPFGIHIFGASSSGKTIALRAAASIWGNSSAHGKTYVNKWGTTLNGLELLCAARSGLSITLDEIRQFKGNFEAVAYMILDGVGKTRMRGNLQQADQWHWKVILLSSGELSTAMITTKSGGDIFTGAQIRLLDLPIEGFLSRSEFTLTSEQADDFRSSLGDDYGLAGPEFVRLLLDEYESYEDLVVEMKLWFEHSKSELAELFPNSQTVQRVLPRFALIHMTGLLAVQMDILPFTEEEITESVKVAIEAWLEAFDAPSDVERAVQDLRSAIITNAHRVIDLEYAEDNNLRPIAYRDDHYIYFTDDHIKEITSHVSVMQVAKQLKEQDALHTNDSRLKVKKDIPGLTIMRVYAVKQSFFGGLEPDDMEPEFNTKLDDVTEDDLNVCLNPTPEEMANLI